MEFMQKTLLKVEIKIKFQNYGFYLISLKPDDSSHCDILVLIFYFETDYCY
jgi:hypothetical protein